MHKERSQTNGVRFFVGQVNSEDGVPEKEEEVRLNAAIIAKGVLRFLIAFKLSSIHRSRYQPKSKPNLEHTAHLHFREPDRSISSSISRQVKTV